jgi:hypothetical protein
MIGPEDRFLHAVVPVRNRAQGRLHGIVLADAASGEEGQSPEAQRAFQHIAAVDRLDQALVLAHRRLVHAAGGPEDGT